MQDEKNEFILIMGATGSGKTSLINTVSQSALKVGHGLRSCTSEVHFSEPFLVEDRSVILFDTPGFDDTNRSDTEILTEIAVFLGGFYQQKKKLIGVLYLHDITNTRMGGTAVRNVHMFNSVVGEAAAKNVVIVTTKWDLIDRKIGEERQKELAADDEFFGNILKKGATIQQYAKGDNPMRLIENIVRKHKRINLLMVDQMADGRKINETDAGKVLNKDIEEALAKQQKDHQEQMDKVIQAMKDANKEQINNLTNLLQKANDDKIKALEAKQAEMNKTLEEAKRTPAGQRATGLLGTLWRAVKWVFTL